MIQVRHDSKRGCGYRKPGGTYLMAAGQLRGCGRLPYPLDRCPTCGGGIKFARSWTWLDADAVFSKRACSYPPPECASCPTITGRVGLLWIGEQFYPTPEAWLKEAVEQGVSRRVPAVPNEFKLGETWVLVAHRKVIPSAGPYCLKVFDGVRGTFCGRGEMNIQMPQGACQRDEGHKGDCSFHIDLKPGIFHAFRPTAVEYVVRGDETPEEIARKEKRGITCVRVLPKDQLPLAAAS